MRKLRIDTALVVLVTGFVFSLAANLLWTWPGGLVRILGGALASLALPGAIHLWPRIPVAGWPTRLLRAGVMTGIAAMAAYTSFSHASSLLIAHGEDPILARLYPITTELLVVMGVLARHLPGGKEAAGRPGRPATKPRARRDDATSPAAAVSQPERTPAPKPVPDDSALPTVGLRAKGLRYARENWPVTSGDIARAVGCSRAEGDRIRQMVKREKEQAS